MRGTGLRVLGSLLFSSLPLLFCACSSMNTNRDYQGLAYDDQPRFVDYANRMPQQIASLSRTVVVDPSVHAWGAYENGQLVRAGNASAGAHWCNDIGRSCRTSVGTFRIASLGGPECKSRIFPLHKGGAPMPYCMFFNGGEALHGVPASEMGDGNYSHGCVRMHVADAEWLRYDFADVGTRVIVRPYN